MTNSNDLYRSAELTEREKRYLRHLTREASTEEALKTFCRYVGLYDTDTNKPKDRPFSYKLARLKQLAAMPNLWNKLK
jgi:hypothetical protein